MRTFIVFFKDGTKLTVKAARFERNLNTGHQVYFYDEAGKLILDYYVDTAAVLYIAPDPSDEGDKAK